MSESNRSNSMVSESGAATTALLGELGKCLPVLPILAAQLREVSRSVEASVVKVCGGFMDIAQRARHTASQVSRLSNGSREAAAANKAGVNELVSDMREILKSLLGRIEQANEFSAVAVGRMETMEANIAKMDRSLVAIEDVTDEARILALNGQLEAARAGAQGVAFAVVAQETAKMAAHARSSCKAAQGLIGGISKSIGNTAEDLRKRATADTRDATQSRDEVNQSLDRMAALHDEIEEALEQSEKNSAQLARDISLTVQTLQFQDAVSQRIEHVIHTLEEIHRAFGLRLQEASAAAPDGAGAGLLTSEWADAMAKSYTMHAERQVLAVQATGGAQGDCEPDNNVELF